MPAQSNEASRPRKRKSPLRRLTRLITIAMVISALVQELSKPAAERTWQGKVWRFVPYDFRMPTWERFRQSVWAPEDPHLFPDRVFGVGWSFNVGRAYAVMNRSFRMPAGMRPKSVCADSLHFSPRLEQLQ
jgi:hypothetical protein